MEDRNSYYIVMELVTGGNLLEVMQKKSKITEAEGAKLIKQLVLALNYMH